MPAKRPNSANSLIKVNDYTLVQIDDELIRAIVRDEIAKANQTNIALISQAILEIKKIGPRIEAINDCCFCGAV